MDITRIHHSITQIDANDFSIENSTFINGSLRNSKFDQVNLEGATLSDINASKMAITNANLTGTEISDCNLTGVAISDCNLAGMTIDGIPVQNLLAQYRVAALGRIVGKAYAGFNERNIDHVFSVMHPNVHWPKAFEGGYVIGYDAVRAYWTKQWSEINPTVEPLSITERPDGKVEVEVHQLVKGLEGSTLFDGKVRHIYVIENDLIMSMDIE